MIVVASSVVTESYRLGRRCPGGGVARQTSSAVTRATVHARRTGRRRDRAVRCAFGETKAVVVSRAKRAHGGGGPATSQGARSARD